MRFALAILVLTLGLQPLPSLSCDMGLAAAAQHAGHDGVAVGPGHECCDTPDSNTGQNCPRMLDCSHAGSIGWALANPTDGRVPAADKHWLTAGFDPIPRTTTSPPFRPPAS